MFYECSSLSSLPDISKWNFKNVRDISNMFDGCLKLESLPNISMWNINDNVREIRFIFDGCLKLESLTDISELYKILLSLIESPKIYIQDIKGNLTEINCLINSTIKIIKDKIKDKKGIPQENQLLFYKKKLLEDEKTLEEYHIKKSSTIHILIKDKKN